MSATQFLRMVLKFDQREQSATSGFSYAQDGNQEGSDVALLPSSSQEAKEAKKSSVRNKNYKFFPLFSVVLSSLLLPFSADIVEAGPYDYLLARDHGNLNRTETFSTGDPACSTSGDEVCARATSSRALLTIKKVPGTTDSYTFTKDNRPYGPNGGGPLRDPGTTATFKVNNAMLKGNIVSYNGQTIDMYFHNSVLVGNYKSQDGGYTVPTWITFDGNYNGDTDPSLKGKAFKGDVDLGGGLSPIFTFKNGATAQISNFTSKTYNPVYGSYGLNLQNNANVTVGELSSTVAYGYVSVKDGSTLTINTLGYRGNGLTITATNKSTINIKNFQKITGNVSWWSWTSASSPASADGSGLFNVINIDNSTLNATLNPEQPDAFTTFSAGKTSFVFNFTNNAKFNGKIVNKLTATDQGNGLQINLKNTTIDNIDYTETGKGKKTPNFLAADSSTLGFKNNTLDYGANITVKDSTLKDLTHTNGDLVLNASNAEIGNIVNNKDGKLVGTIDSSNVGDITSDNNWKDSIKITNTQGKENLKIGNITFKGIAKGASDDVKIDINLDKGATVGNIDAGKAALNATFNGASVGNITNNNTDTAHPSSLTFANTAGQSIGQIGSDSAKFNGDINGTFDFTPVTITKPDGTTETKSLSVGNIASSSTAKNDLSFVFGGKDSKGNTLGKPTTPITITGGSKDSSYTFANLGNLSTDSTQKKTISTVSGIQFGSDAGVGSVNLVGTSVSLKKGEQLDKNTVVALLGTTSSNVDLKSANLVFGNAKLETKPDGTTEIVKNTDDSGKPVVATLTTAGTIHKPGDGYVAGLSSDANIAVPSADSGFSLKADFVYTPDAFDAKKGQTAWTGKLTGDVQNADISFANAGVIDTSQLGSVGDLKLSAQGTTLTGIVGGDVNVVGEDGKTITKPQDVTLGLDLGPNTSSKGVSIVGDGKHDVTLDFSGNTSPDKFAGAILGGSDDSSLTIKNLDGIKINSASGGSIVDGLKAAGITGINNPNAAKKFDGTPLTLTDSQKKDISTKTEFKLTGSTIEGNIKDNNYSYNLSFDNQPTKDENGKDIPSAHYSGTSISFSNNSNAQDLSFLGKGSINPTTNQALTISAGTGDTKLDFDNTGATVVLKDTTAVGKDSALNSSGTSIIGDWTKGGADMSFDSNSKFYGTIGGSGDKPISITLGKDSLYSSKDPVVSAAYDGSLKSTDDVGKPVFAPAVVDLSSTGKKELNFTNPGSSLTIKGLTKDNGLDKGNIVADNMSLTGNLYSKLDPTTQASNVKAQLNFDSTDTTPTSFTTDHIGILANGSNISFNGEGSLKPLTPYDATTKKGGIVSIDLGGSSTGNTNFTLNNTGSTVEFAQLPNQTDLKGNFDIRGTNIILDNGLSAWEGSKVNLVFVNSNSATKDMELKTQDGSLLTSKTTLDGTPKPSTDYVNASSLTLKSGTVSLKGKQNNITFIGDSSVLATPSVTKPMELAGNGAATINLVNMGTALATPLAKIIQAQGVSVDQVAALQTAKITDAAMKTATQKGIKDFLNSKTMADLLMESNNAGTKGSVKYTYNLAGTTIGSVSILAPKSTDGLNQANVYVNASFDSRDIKDRTTDAQKYYTNKSAIGNSKVEIGKSALNGDLALDPNVHANITFAGKGAIGSNTTISGGANDSTFTFIDTDLNFGASSSFSNLQMNGKLILDGVNATGSFAPTTKPTIVSVVNGKQVQGLIFKNYATDDVKTTALTDNLQKNGNLMGIATNLSGVQSIKDTSFIGTIDSDKATTFVFAGTQSNGFNQTDSTKSTSLGIAAKNITLDLIDTGVVQVGNINKGKSITNDDGTTTLSGNTINLYGQSALSLSNGTDGKKVLKIGGDDSLQISATIDSSNAKLWGGDTNGVSFDVEGASETNSVYNLTFNGGIPYPDYNKSFYTGKIGLLNKKSVINFTDAGILQSSQFNNTLAAVNLTRTTITGDFFFNQGVQDFTNTNTAFKGNVIFKDPTDNQKNLYFNFTGNTKADKIDNNIARDHNFYLAGGAGSNFNFVNLTDNHLSSNSSPLTWVASSDSSDSVFNTLGTAGVHLRAGTSNDKKTFAGTEVAQTLDNNSTFGFLGTSIKGDINTKYSLNLNFYNLDDGQKTISPSFDKNTKIALGQSSYSGSHIHTQGSLSLVATGAGALGDKQVILTAVDGPLYIEATSSAGEVGSIKTTGVKVGSSLIADHLGFEGDFITQKDDSAKGMPKNGDINATFSDDELKNGFTFGTKDGELRLKLSNLNLSKNADGTNPTEKIIVGQGTTNLEFKNAGTITLVSSKTVSDDNTSFDANSKGYMFKDGSVIKSEGTSIIGNIYTNNWDDKTFNPNSNSGGTYILAFDAKGGESTNSSYYAGNYIGAGFNQSKSYDSYSKLSFYGKGSLKTLDADGNVGDVKNVDYNKGGAGLTASDVDLTIASHNINRNNEPSSAPSITMINTGGVVSFEQYRQSAINQRLDLPFYYSLNLKGVSVYGDDFTGGVGNLNTNGSKKAKEPVKFQMTFANGNGTETTLTDDKGAKVYITDSKAGDEYIEQSAYGLKSFKNSSGINSGFLAPTLTFIGSSSHNFYDSSYGSNSAKLFWTNMNDTKINFINADDKNKIMNFSAFNQTITQILTGSDSNILTSANLKNSPVENYGTMNLIGTNVKDADLSKTAFTLNFAFDQRGNDQYFATDDSGNIITTDAYGAFSSSILKVRKSSLSGTLTLGDKVNANLSFLGESSTTDNKGVVTKTAAFDAANASVIGGNANSKLVMSGIDNIKYTSFNTFNGKSTIVNSSFNGDLIDDASKAGSAKGVLSAIFNMQTPTLSEDGQKFVDDYNGGAIDGAKLDLSKAHTINSKIGKTAGELDLTLIGKGSIGDNFKISTDDNAKNVYAFVDFGEIDLKKLSTDSSGKINGQVKWIGDSYQIGEVTGQVSGTVDVTQNGSKIEHNTYQASGGSQDLTFDFGGSTLNPDGSKKQIGVIKDAPDIKDNTGKVTKPGGATADSTYTISGLTNANSSNPANQALSTTDDSPIINVVNDAINDSGDASKNPFQNTTGTIGIKDTSINGDLNQDKNYKGTDGKDATFNGTIQATFDTTAGNKNPSILTGNVAGDVTKDLTFKGEAELPFKNGKVISGGDKNSQYSFENTGTIDSDTLANILNAGQTLGVAQANTAGTFDFEGNTTINADIKDGRDHSNAKNQTIKLGKDSSKSPNGVVYNGSITTSSKVDATFGVGSSVSILSNNKNSKFDFSKFAGSSTPVVATILNDVNPTEAANVIGFNGNTSLRGTIKDAKNSYVFKGGNGQKAGQWILTDTSNVNNLTVSNTKITQEALEAPTLNNPLAIIDLTGNDSVSSGASLNGAILNGAMSSNMMIGGASLVNGAQTSSGFVPINLSIASLNANNAVFRLAVDLDAGVSSQIGINGISGNVKATNYLQFYPQAGTGTTLNAPIKVATIVGRKDAKGYFKGANSKVGLRTYTPEIVAQGYTYRPTKVGATTAPSTNYTDFYLNALTYTQNDKAISTLNQTLSSAYRGFRIETNNLHLRMGELRNIGASQGAWARIMNGMGSDDKVSDFYTTIQAGYDYKFDVLGGVNYVGVTADTSFIFSRPGKGVAGPDNKGNTLGIGIYNTYLMDNGLYVDAITKYLYLHNQLSGGELASTQSFGSSAFLLGGEVGYRYKLDSVLPFFHIASNPYTTGFYVEPQVELIYGYIGGADLTTTVSGVTPTKVNASLLGNNALISRVGAVIGKQIRTNSFVGDIRLGLSYVNEMNTGGTMALSDQSADTPITTSTPTNNKLALSLGTNVKINDDWRVYADISRTFFGIYNIDYNLNIGGRWNFGKKTSNQARQLREERDRQKKLELQRAKEAKMMQQQAAKNSQAKETIKADKILTIAQAKTGCVGCAPESGYYLKIVTISAKNANLEKQLKGHPYRIYSFRDAKNKVLLSYLAGPYKTQAELNKEKSAIDKITQWANQNKTITSEVYEVKNSKK